MFVLEFYFRIFWQFASLILAESIHLCKRESKAYKHAKIICFEVRRDDLLSLMVQPALNHMFLIIMFLNFKYISQ